MACRFTKPWSLSESRPPCPARTAHSQRGVLRDNDRWQHARGRLELINSIWKD
jgi:hypothetical protein